MAVAVSQVTVTEKHASLHLHYIHSLVNPLFLQFRAQFFFQGENTISEAGNLMRREVLHSAG